MDRTMYNLCTIIFEVLIYFDFMHDILEQRFENKWTKMLVLMGMGAVIFSINSADSTWLNLMLFPIVCLVGSFILYVSGIKACILYTVMFWVIVAGLEFVGGFLYMILKGDNVNIQGGFPFDLLLLAVFVKLVSFAMLRLVKLFLNRKSSHVEGRFVNTAFAMTFTTMVIYAGLFYADTHIEKGKGVLGAGCILLLFSNVLVFYILEELARSMDRNKEFELQALQNDWSRTYYDRLEEMDFRNRKYVHDLKEYLGVIGGLAANGEDKEITDILKDMEIEIDRISDKRYSSNSILNAILCEKEYSARKAGVAIDMMIEPGLNVDFIKSGDLIIMLGNLAQNAIEAAAICNGTGHVDLKFFASEGNFIVLNIENDYINEIKKEHGRYVSSKKDKKRHGLGLKSVEDTVEKYGGMLYTEQKEGRFIVILTISKTFYKEAE